MVLYRGLMYLFNRITDGRPRTSWGPTTGSSPSATTLAFPVRTRTSARRKVITASGSYPAFRTRVRIRIPLHGRTRQGHEGRLPSAWSGYGSTRSRVNTQLPDHRIFFHRRSLQYGKFIAR